MAGESQSKLAAEFGVSQATVNKIILRETWKHI
jgi:DNA-binding XRE family transcriptional regulator